MNEQPYTLKDVYGDLTPNIHRDSHKLRRSSDPKQFHPFSCALYGVLTGALLLVTLFIL